MKRQKEHVCSRWTLFYHLGFAVSNLPLSQRKTNDQLCLVASLTQWRLRKLKLFIRVLFRGQPSSKDQIKCAFCFTWPQNSSLSAGGSRGHNAKPKSKRTTSPAFCTTPVLRVCLQNRPEAKKLMPVNFVGVYCHRVNSSNQKYSAVFKSLRNPWALSNIPAGQRLCSHRDSVPLNAHPRFSPTAYRAVKPSPDAGSWSLEDVGEGISSQKRSRPCQMD